MYPRVLIGIHHFIRALPRTTSGCEVYEEDLDSLEDERDQLLKAGRQDEEKERSLRTKLKANTEDIKETNETIEQLEKALENPSKVSQYIFPQTSEMS